MTLTPKPNPQLNHVKRLLEHSNLIASDLNEAAMKNFYGVYSEEKLLGVIGLEASPPVGLLRSLAVSPTARGKGLGRQLVDAIEQHARDLALESMYLLTNDADDYFTTRGYEVYQRDLAPQAIKHSTQFSELCPASAVVMRKKLTR